MAHDFTVEPLDGKVHSGQANESISHKKTEGHSQLPFF
jgi:hypothetical protein